MQPHRKLAVRDQWWEAIRWVFTGFSCSPGPPFPIANEASGRAIFTVMAYSGFIVYSLRNRAASATLAADALIGAIVGLLLCHPHPAAP